jgi:hypothetical protein
MHAVSAAVVAVVVVVAVAVDVNDVTQRRYWKMRW